MFDVEKVIARDGETLGLSGALVLIISKLVGLIFSSDVSCSRDKRWLESSQRWCCKSALRSLRSPVETWACTKK